MEYNEQKSIYQQIADALCEKILTGDWKEGERIPSVRQLASNFQVNPNTVMRTYNFLQDTEIIYNKRGIGYFLTDDAKQKTMEVKKQEFLSIELPQFVNKMKLLGYKISDLSKLLKTTNNENK